MQRLLKLSLIDALAETSLKASISDITSESYSNPGVLLVQEFRKNNQIYLSLSPNGRLEAFFMVGWSEIVLHGQSIDCVFLGLSAATSMRKGSGLALTLYRRFFHDAIQAANVSNRPVAWWFNTASPIVAGVMWRLAKDIGPKPDGTLSARHQELLTSIQDRYNFSPFKDGQVPCVLRGFAQARYSPVEVARLSARRTKESSILDHWHINEAARDRVIFVGQCFPSR
jgi:hypothetical protein